MNTELNAMIDCPEIQSLAVWEVGEMTNCGRLSYSPFSEKPVIRIGNYINSIESFEGLLYIPTEKDVVGWLEKITHEFSTHYDKNFSGKAKYSACIGYRCFDSDTLLKALLKLFMWVEFGKEWNEGEWE